MKGVQKDDLLAVLLREAEGTAAAIRSLFLFSERVIALGLSLLALGASVGVAQDAQEVLVALPFGVISLAGYGLVHLGTELLMLGGYRRYLEESINDLVGGDALTWESKVVPKLRRLPNPDGLILLWTVVTGIVATGILGFQAAAGLGAGTVLLLSGVLTVSAGLIVFGIIRMRSASDRAYRTARGEVVR